ncbi:uncharacterized protein BP5553_08631 [Venustampulla echinocandica]|uniref:Uncharacterized protein n=1 Tax=Venustampulla echinocandica TaxID=2656787 RepID=A0A370TES3_9HELO|nr:uncharacterized protein BP5553_08631 [Venustampulla echinocandica]RDL33192.1 hypothetical protein BP5553_08631 [Venustampulla echinocandica]
MNARQRQLTPTSPPSLSILEPASSTTLQPRTQAPTTPIEDKLPRHGISKDRAEAWNRKYNYESLPRMHEDFFYGLLIEVAGEINPADEEFESKVESKVGSIMEEKSTQSREKFDDTAYEIIGTGFKLFQDKELSKSWYHSFLDPHSIHSLETFFANCLPVLINKLRELRERKSKGRKRGSTGNTWKRSPKVQKPIPESDGGTGTRRSSRIKKSHTPHSEQVLLQGPID